MEKPDKPLRPAPPEPEDESEASVEAYKTAQVEFREELKNWKTVCTDMSRDFRNQLAHYNKIKRKKEPVAPFIPLALPRYEKGSNEDEEAELAFVNVHIMNKISGEWVRQYLTMDAFQSRLIPSANVYEGMRVNLVHEPHEP